MLPAAVEALACPVCHRALREDAGSLRCAAGHSYDIAKQGYVTLRAGSGPRHEGDDAAMVAARIDVLSAGLFDGLAARVAAAATTAYPGTGVVLDAGGGTGFYLTHVLDRLAQRAVAARGPGGEPAGLVLDASPYALRRATRAHPAVGAAGADLWGRWPVRDGVAGLVLGVFAPRNGAEMQRVLRPDGALILVTPGPRHLVELVGALHMLSVDARKDERVGRSLVSYFDQRAADRYEEQLDLDHAAVAALVGMGPSARHLEPADLAARVAALPDPVRVTLSATVMTWAPRRD